MPDLFRHPPGGRCLAAGWIPEQVRDDGLGCARGPSSPEIPACAGMTIGVMEFGRTSPLAFDRSKCDRRGSATSSAAGTLHVDRGVSSGMPACNHPMRRHPVKGWPRNFYRVAVFRKPLESFPSSIARGHPTRCRPEAAVLAGGCPSNVVRIAPLHDAGITMRLKPHAEICTLWAKVPSHACRGASRRSCPLA